MKTENHRIEFKRQLSDSLEKEAVAILNARDGGVIMIGVDDQGKVVGVSDADTLQLQIKDHLKNNIKPSTMGLFDVAGEQQSDKTLINNDFSNEVPPKFELFSDRLEITSAGVIPAGFSEEELFMGYSVIPRILQHFPSSVYRFTPNFIRVVFPFADSLEDSTTQATPQASYQADQVLRYCLKPRSRKDIQENLGLKDREHFCKSILQPLLESGKLRLTLPDKPTSPKQNFQTARGLSKQGIEKGGDNG